MPKTKRITRNSTVYLKQGDYPSRYLNRTAIVQEVKGSTVYLDFFPRRTALLPVRKADVSKVDYQFELN